MYKPTWIHTYVNSIEFFKSFTAGRRLKPRIQYVRHIIVFIIYITMTAAAFIIEISIVVIANMVMS